MIDLAAKARKFDMKSAEIRGVLYDEETQSLEATTIPELMQRFERSQFDIKDGKDADETYYHLEKILTAKVTVFGMKALYNYLVRKLTAFEFMTKDEQIDKILDDLRFKFKKKQLSLLEEYLKAKTSEEKYYLADFFVAFDLIDPTIQKQHKFAFACKLLSEDPNKEHKFKATHILQSSSNI